VTARALPMNPLTTVRPNALRLQVSVFGRVPFFDQMGRTISKTLSLSRHSHLLGFFLGMFPRPQPFDTIDFVVNNFGLSISIFSIRAQLEPTAVFAGIVVPSHGFFINPKERSKAFIKTLLPFHIFPICAP
jgi:hypothetical protein